MVDGVLTVFFVVFVVCLFVVLVGHPTAICDSIAAIPPYKRPYSAEGRLELRDPPPPQNPPNPPPST